MVVTILKWESHKIKFCLILQKNRKLKNKRPATWDTTVLVLHTWLKYIEMYCMFIPYPFH